MRAARDLTDPLSVQAGIGPVRVQRYGTTREEIIAGCPANEQRELVSA